MLRCQEQLKIKNSELQDHVSLQKQKINLLYKAQDKSSAVLRDAYVDYEKCPICGKKYKTLSYVDKHIQNHHKLHLMAWKSLRVDVPINPQAQVKELQKEIANLHKQIDTQTEKFAQTILDFQTQIVALKKEREDLPKEHPQIQFVEFDPQKSPKTHFMQHQNDNYATNSSGHCLSPPFQSPNPFQPSVITVQNDLDSNPASDSPKNLEERMQQLRKKTKATAKNLSYGLGPNYLQKGQASRILKFPNTTYTQLHREAEIELEDQFPLPGQQPHRKHYDNPASSLPSTTAATTTAATTTAATNSTKTTGTTTPAASASASRRSSVSSRHSKSNSGNSSQKHPQLPSQNVKSSGKDSVVKQSLVLSDHDSDYNESADSDPENPVLESAAPNGNAQTADENSHRDQEPKIESNPETQPDILNAKTVQTIDQEPEILQSVDFSDFDD